MGQYADAFHKVATRAVATGVLTVALASTFVAPASAQTAGQPPGPDNGAQTQTYQDPAQAAKPWSNDPDYQRMIKAYDAQAAARETNYQAQETGQIRLAHDNAGIARASQPPVNFRAGVQGVVAAGNVQNQIAAGEKTQDLNQATALNTEMSNEAVQRLNYVAGLDQRFQALPFYKNGGVAPPGAVMPWQNDPGYVQKIQDYDAQANIRKQTYGIQEGAQLTQINTSLQTQTIANNTAASSYLRQPNGAAIADLRQDVTQTSNGMQVASAQAGWNARFATEDASRANFIFGLNAQMGASPAYKTAPRVVAGAGQAQPGGVAGPPPAPRPPGS